VTQDDQKNATGGKDSNADQLAGSEHTQVVRRIIASKDFDRGAQDCIGNQINPEYMPIKFLSRIEPGQGYEQEQIQACFVNLRWVNASAAGRVFFWEMDCPWQAACASVTTARHQASDASKRMPQSHTGGQNIGYLPERESVFACIDDRPERRADQPSIKNKPTANLENLPDRLASEVLLPVANHIKRSRSDDRPADEPRG